MERALRMDMVYEGSSAGRMIPEEYRDRTYDRAAGNRKGKAEHRREDRTPRGGAGQSAGGTRSGRQAQVSGSRAAWREPAGAGRNARYGMEQPAWKEPAYDAGRRRQGRTQAAVRRQTANTAGRKKKRIQRSIARWLLFYFCIAGIAATLWVIFGLFFGGGKTVETGEARRQDEMSGMVSEGAAPAEWKEAGMAAVLEITPEMRQECQELYTRNESLLTLVNKEHELSASRQPMLRSICKGRLQAADVLYGDLCAMLEAGGSAGYEYWIASAHRDRAYQQGLVDEDVEKYMSKGYSYEAALRKTYEYTMPAGKSEHETGLALDILCSTNTIMDESQRGEPGNRWLVEHCHEYGFILRYPEDKEEITGIQYEPWHFRYVGREAAAFLTERGWTLEEFYGALQPGMA